MKSIITTILIVACTVAQAQKPKTVKAKLKAVTVYLKGADLYYNEKVSLAAGNNTLIFENISPYINISTASAYCKAGVVMDVRHQIKYKEKTKSVVTKKYDSQIAQVLDSIEQFNYLKKDYQNKLSALSIEKKMMLSNPIIKGDFKKDSLQLLESAMELVRKKLTEIYSQELKYEKLRNTANKTITRLKKRHKTLLLLRQGRNNNSNNNAEPIHQLIVNVFAKTAVYTTINFNYFTRNAHWVPSYDLQASSTTGKLGLKYFAGIVQTTGLDWKRAKLTISTSSPTQNHTKPTLSPWQLSFMEYRRSNPGSMNQLSNSALSLKRESLYIDGVVTPNDKALEGSLVDYIKISENILRTEYKINLNYTIKTDGQPYKVLINEGELPMNLEYAAVPKLSSNAYLLAKVTDWEDLNIIPGKARLYFDNSFSGEMYFNAFTDADTLKFSLGKDKGIALTRKKVKEKIKSRILKENKVETRTIEIVAKNMKNRTIEMEIEDQIPVVLGTDKIEVVLIDGDGATLTKENGSLKWKVKLKAKKRKKLKFTYEIRYPKNKRIAGL